MRRCRVCECTQLTACEMPDGGPCWWVGEDLCSACSVDEDLDAAGDGFERDERTGLWMPVGSYEA